MIMHPRMDTLRAYGGDELVGDGRRRTAEHVARCPRCRSTLAWMDGVRAAAAASPPDPAPHAWHLIATRVAAGDTVLLPADERPPSPATHPSRSFVRPLRVAGVALAVAAAAAAAVPGSPVRSFIEAMVSAPLPIVEDAPVPDSRVEAVTGTGQPPVVLLIEPAAGGIIVSLQRPDSAVRVHVRLIDGSELEVQALDGAAGATFRSAPGRLEIVAAHAGAVVLGLPRSVQRARVDVDGRPILVRERGETRILAPTADTVGAEYILPVHRTGGTDPDLR